MPAFDAPEPGAHVRKPADRHDDGRPGVPDYADQEEDLPESLQETRVFTAFVAPSVEP